MIDIKELERLESLNENIALDDNNKSIFDTLLSDNYHILISGSTGSGKSVLINGFICEYLKQSDHGSIYIIDPKRIGFLPFKKCKAVKILATKEKQFIPTLECTIKNMDLRYKYMEKAGIDTFPGDEILLVIDEFADLVSNNKTVEKLIITLLRLGRQAKIRILLATQSPSRKVITAEIQQNCGFRIGLRTTNRIESTQIIGCKGCEDLPRYGESLILAPGESVTPYAVPYTAKEQIIDTINNYK